MALSITNPRDFAVAVITKLGYQPTHDAVRAYVAWQRVEGGFKHKNPFNTTQNAPGASTFNSVGVKTYPDWDTAVNATVTTLRNGRYGPILAATKAGDAAAIADAIGNSPWGTSSDLIHRVLGSTPQQPVPPTPVAPRPQPQAAPTASQSPDVRQQRGALISQYLSNQHSSDALTGLAAGLLAMGVPEKVAKKAVPATGQPGDSPITVPGSQPDAVRAAMERANQIDAKHYPYVWGGGHSKSGVPDGGTGRDPGIGFDCSGAVAAVLGVDPRHSSQFASWGKPGRAPGGKGVTVFSNGHHVLMMINGHFWGTSRTNPGGGAGWIPRAAISESYLSQFVARHL